MLTVTAIGASACVRTSAGLPIAASTDPPTASSTIPTPKGRVDQDVPGVLPTVRTPLPAGSATCTPAPSAGVKVRAAVADPEAPTLMVTVPDGWSSQRGSGDVAVTMDGPDGMAATVTIAATRLDPAAAFRQHTDALMEGAAVSTVSVMPAELCSYSGQTLTGARSEVPQRSVEFTDRIVHVWTTAGAYLICVHVESPAGGRSDDAATASLTADFEIRLP